MSGGSVDQEFVTVDCVLQSGAETLAVDAFALSLIKQERQLRRLLTYSVYQFRCFGPADIQALRAALATNREVFAEGFIRGLDALWPQPIAALVGARYAPLSQSIDRAVKARNKIFHGQVTELGLSRSELLALVADLREWCTQLAYAAQAHFGYDGFGRDSYRKGSNDKLSERFLI